MGAMGFGLGHRRLGVNRRRSGSSNEGEDFTKTVVATGQMGAGSGPTGPRSSLDRAAVSAPVASLPPFSNMRARCTACGNGREIMVIYDGGDCAAVTGGPHFHRRCACGHAWIERTRERAAAKVGN